MIEAEEFTGAVAVAIDFAGVDDDEFLAFLIPDGAFEEELECSEGVDNGPIVTQGVAADDEGMPGTFGGHGAHETGIGGEVGDDLLDFTVAPVADPIGGEAFGLLSSHRKPSIAPGWRPRYS